MANPSNRILIIEDDYQLRSTIEELLRSEGYDTVSARNGREALDVLHYDEAPLSLIVVDLQLPEFDGWNFLEARESFGLAPGVPTIVMSGSASERPLPGMNLFLPKPFSAEKLVSTVRDIAS